MFHETQTGRPGFGLLEVMFATAIFIVVVGSMVSLSRLALRNAVVSVHRVQATNLAQDGLEAVRQIRDTAWIDGDVGANPQTDWRELELVADCGSPSPTYIPISFDVEYEVCAQGSLGNNTLGLKKTKITCSPTITSLTCVQLKDEQGQLEAGAPAWYRRTIIFKQIPATDANLAAFTGLQLLDAGDDGLPSRFVAAEDDHFIKVLSRVSWLDFDREWSVTLDTILTNWKGQ